MSGEPLLACLDVGTSTVRCFLVNKNGHICGQGKTNVRLHFPKKGYVEMHPGELWDSCLQVINEAVRDSGSGFESIKGFGLSCQRNTFITWKKSTKEPYHNFITWNDIRANSIVNEINSSFKFKLMKFTSKIIYTLTRRKRFLAGSVIQMTNNQITPRLIWVLQNIPAVLQDLKMNDVAYGTIDTWLLHKLSAGLLHVTDISSASSTGLYDTFTLNWGAWAFNLFNIPMKIFPQVVDSAGNHFGCISEEIFGFPIPIYCSIADQSASLFGSCCFNKGDLKVTLGTGTFLDVNTGSKPLASFYGLYPLVGWRFNNELVYIAESGSNDTGVLIKWVQDLDIINDPKECSDLVQSVENNGGVYFVPAFNGIQAPVNDAQASAGFIGLKPTTRKTHLLRAVLESIVFRVVQLFLIFKSETHLNPSSVRIDGGVSNNDFIVQMLADSINVPVHRPSITEMTAMGVAFMSGLIAGFWESKDELCKISSFVSEFIPEKTLYETRKEEYATWSRAIKRFFHWHTQE